MVSPYFYLGTQMCTWLARHCPARCFEDASHLLGSFLDSSAALGVCPAGSFMPSAPLPWSAGAGGHDGRPEQGACSAGHLSGRAPSAWSPTPGLCHPVM